MFLYPDVRSMKKLYILLILILISCSASRKLADNSIVEFTILQFNDFYEIAGIENGTRGGCSRITTLRNKLLKENKNLLTVLAGDFISPSLTGTLVFEGEKIKGKQIIECLNATGIDLVCFGNHEFDHDQKTLQKRINESQFDWISSNVYEVHNGSNSRFLKYQNGISEEIPTNRIYTFSNQSGKIIKVGIISPCVDANKAQYVLYENIYESTERELNILKDKVDYIICLSHLDKEQDMEIARRFPKINLILGGHEHYNMFYQIGNTRLTKADANARTAYIHRVKINTNKSTKDIESELVELNSSIPKDEKTELVVRKWVNIESKIIREMGFSKEEVIPGEPVHYITSESTFRSKQTNFGKLVCKSMLATCDSCLMAFFNSGSSRQEDDIIGTISQYDILKTFPYAGSIIELEILGDVLIKTLNAGINNKGKGGYLQYYNVNQDSNGKWLIKDKLIDEKKYYKVMSTEFLMSGKERGMDFLNKNNPGIKNIIIPEPTDLTNIKRDIRMVIIDYLKKGGR